MKTILVFVFYPLFFFGQYTLPKNWFSASVGFEFPVSNYYREQIKPMYNIKYNFPANTATIKIATLMGQRTYLSPALKFIHRDGEATSRSSRNGYISSRNIKFSVSRLEVALAIITALGKDQNIFFGYGLFVSGVVQVSGDAISYSTAYSTTDPYIINYSAKLDVIGQFGARLELWQRYRLSNKHFIKFGIYAQLETQEVYYGRGGQAVGLQAGYMFAKSQRTEIPEANRTP